MREELQKKVDFAIKLLQSIPQDGDIELSYSGGKDSDVILELTKMAGIPYRAIYKNTTIDPAGTIAHAREMGAEVIYPKKTFFQIVQEYGFPSRHQRFCCSFLNYAGSLACANCLPITIPFKNARASHFVFSSI